MGVGKRTSFLGSRSLADRRGDYRPSGVDHEVTDLDPRNVHKTRLVLATKRGSTMTNETEMAAFINPLTFPYIDSLSPDTEDEVSPELLIHHLCTPGHDFTAKGLVERYRQIRTTEGLEYRLIVAPQEQTILNKLIWPLRNATVSYLLGNYLGTISLCGVSAEMLAIFLFELGNDKITGLDLTEAEQRNRFNGKTFEELDQGRRASELKKLDLINSKVKKLFGDIRSARRRYIHLWSQDHDAIAKDAVNCYKAALSITLFAFPQAPRNGKVMMNPRLFEYLRKKRAQL